MGGGGGTICILFVTRNNLEVKLMSKSLDLPYTPGEGYKQFLSGMVSLALLSCLSTERSLSVMAMERLAGL